MSLMSIDLGVESESPLTKLNINNDYGGESWGRSRVVVDDFNFKSNQRTDIQASMFKFQSS